MLVVGLTGGIGAGKSTVAAMLAERGALVVDVDAVGRQILELGGTACAAVAERFGPQVVRPDGGIDRAALAAMVFQDPQALRDLEGISHPRINEVLERVMAAEGNRVVVLDMAVLVESQLGRRADGSPMYDVVVVVEAPWEMRLARLADRGMSADEASARRSRQASDEGRRAVADYVIVNDSDQEVLATRVGGLWSELVRRA